MGRASRFFERCWLVHDGRRGRAVSGALEVTPALPGDLESQILLERRLARIRWFGVGLGMYLMSQLASTPPPLPSRAAVLGVDAMVLLLGLGNAVLEGLLRRGLSLRDVRRAGASMFGLDCAVIIIVVWLFSSTPKDTTWALLYVLPLEAALRYTMTGALWTAAGVAVSELVREAHLASEFPRVGFVIPDVAFRIGVGIIIASVAGLMSRSLLREADRLRVLADEQTLTMNRLARQEAETRESNRLLRRTDEQRRKLLSHLLVAQEQERRQLAVRIQDDPLQHIVAAGMRVSALRSTLSDPGQRAALGGVADTVQIAVDRLRNLLFELAPGSLDRSGIVATLRAYVEEMDPSAKVTITTHLDEEPPPDTKVVIFRVAQEALLNASRNGDATEIEVLFRRTDGGIYLRVADNGSGMGQDEPAFSPRQLALKAIRERTELSGGWFHLLSAPGSGTIIECWVPAAALVEIDR
jgi:signal transduction histidine kinase